MRKRERTKTLVGMALVSIMIAGMGILIGPVAGHAVNCPDVLLRGPLDWTDTDGDGFTDYDECHGILLRGSSIPMVMDPNVKDVFVVLIRATETGATRTNIPANWSEFLSNPMSRGGLGIRVHEVTKDQVESDRTVCLSCSLAIGSKTIRQKAVRVTESLDPGTTDQQKKTFGLAEWGTPNGLDDATIWTDRIINYVRKVCGTSYGSSSCKDKSTGAYGTALNERYIKSVMAHEIGHMIKLTGGYTSSYGGYHYKSGTGVEMDQAMAVTGTVFKIGTVYKAADQSDPQMGFQLK